MAFRYLIYRTDFGNTIVRESSTDTSTGGTEASLFTDFVIPEIQPLYLWRVTGGTDVVPNTDQNIEDWLSHTNPPTPDDPITYNIFTGYTAQTAGDIAYISGVTDDNYTIFQSFTAATTSDLSFISGATDQNSADILYISGITDNKLDKVSGSTNNNVVVFGDSGNTLVDSGYNINDLLSSGVSLNIFTGYTATTEVRLDGIDDDIAYLSGVTDQNIADIGFLGTFSADTVADLSYISGITDTKLDISDFNSYTGATRTELDLTITGATNGLTKSGRNVLLGGTLTQNTSIDGSTGAYNLELLNLNAFNLSFNSISTITDSGANGGLHYAADYSAQFVNRSLVDKAYVDAVAAGLDLKESVRATTTTGNTDIDLGGGTFGGTIDGYTVQDGDRVLIKNQDSAKEDNGIYVYASGTNTFSRAIDFENPYVTSGAFTFVETGSTYASSGWVLVTQDPISIDTTPLTFTQFSAAGLFTAGVGINITSNVISLDGISIAGDFLNWTGTQLNVTGLTSVSDFNSFTAATTSDLAFISGVTDTNTADIVYISGITDSNTTRIENLESAVSGITGGTYVTIEEFTGYTATTETRFTGIENDINYISGISSGHTQDIAYISGVTDTKLDESVFTGYTASTQSNELFLVHTGGTNINTVAVTEISWDSGITIGSAYTWTGGSAIFIDETGDYELSYNIPFAAIGTNADIGIGMNIALNTSTIIDITGAAGFVSRSLTADSLTLATINISLNANDRLDLVGFRTGQAGTANTVANGSILIKKKSSLQ